MNTSLLRDRPVLEHLKEPLTRASSEPRLLEERMLLGPANDLTVVVVAYNERETLLGLLRKLTEQVGRRASVLVLDNGLDRDVREAVLEFNLHYARARGNLGCCGGRNVGAGLVESPLLSFLDADAAIGDDYVDTCFDVMSDPATLAVRGKVESLTPGAVFAAHYDLGETRFPRYPDTEGVSVWRSEAFQEAGGFEEALYGHEGVVLCHRMIELYGARPAQFIYDPRLAIGHDFVADPEVLHAKILRNQVFRWQVDRKYPLLESTIAVFAGLARAQDVQSAAESSPLLVKTAREVKAEIAELRAELPREQVLRRRSAPDAPNDEGRFAFTVVIPCYNLHRRVGKAVTSVLRQTLDGVEIIIVDDASPDPEARTVLEQWSDVATVIYRSENGGASAARNTGVAAARSDYILCLDADDTITTTYLEDAYNVFEMLPDVGVVASHVRYQGRRTGVWKVADHVTAVDALSESPIGNASCYRKSVWEAADGYDESMRGYEDWEYWIRALQVAGPARTIPRPHYRYLVRGGSKVATSNRNAKSIVTYIVSKHSGAYAANIAQVLPRKHEQVVSARARAARAELELLELRDAMRIPARSRIRGYASRVKRRVKRVTRRVRR